MGRRTGRSSESWFTIALQRSREPLLESKKDNCEDIKQLLDEKHRLHEAYLSNPNSRLRLHCSLQGRWHNLERKAPSAVAAHVATGRWQSPRTEFKDASIIHDVIPGGEVLAQASLLNINTILMQSHLSWTGRVLRMPNHQLPVKLFYGEILHEKCSHEGQMKCVKDTLINTDTWEQTAMDRVKWCICIHKGPKTCGGWLNCSGGAKKTAQESSSQESFS